MKFALVIMIRNEIDGIVQLYNQIPFDKFDEVLAIDGMSSDGSAEFLKKKGVDVVTQKINGRGQAFRDAFNNTDSDILLFYGPDGNEDPADVIRFIDEFKNNKTAGMVVARRLGPGAINKEDHKFFKPRKWVNIVFNLMANLIWNRNNYVYDTINGFRAISRKTWNKINIDTDGYTVEYQSTIRCFKHNIKIVEFPTQELQRIGDKAGAGSPAFHTGVAFIKLFVSELFSSFLTLIKPR